MPFKKGQSGNPGGRPKMAPEMREMARAHTGEAIAALVSALEDKGQRVSAAVALLDRGWGKPAQYLEHTGKDGGPLQVEDTTLLEKAMLIGHALRVAAEIKNSKN